MPTFDARQHKELGQYIGTELEKAMRRGLLSAAVRIVQHIKTVLIPAEPRVPIDRGHFAAGFKSQKTSFGAEVYNDVPYAGIIENGVPAGHVRIGRLMIQALAEWAKRKGLVAKKQAVAGKQHANFTSVRFVKKSSDQLNRDSISTAWAIAKAMQKNGIFKNGKGLRIVTRAMKEASKFVTEEVAREIGRK